MNYASDGQHALGQLITDCAAEVSCQSAYPTLRDDVDLLLDRARLGLIRTAAGNGDTVVVHRDAVAGAIFSALQSTNERAALPAIISAAARGASAPVANAVLRLRRTLDTMIASLSMSIGVGEADCFTSMAHCSFPKSSTRSISCPSLVRKKKGSTRRPSASTA